VVSELDYSYFILCLSLLNLLINRFFHPSSEQAESLPEKRVRRSTNLYIAKPSGDAKMNSTRQRSFRVSTGRFRNKTKDDEIENIKVALDHISRKDISDKLLPHLFDQLSKTTRGCNGLARAISRKEKVYVPSGRSSLSKSWRNKMMRSAVDVRHGLSTFVNPDNPKEYASMLMTQTNDDVQQVVTAPVVAVVPTCPRNPATTETAAILPQRVHPYSQNASDLQMTLPPSETPPPLVTKASLASIMPDDDDDDPNLPQPPDSSNSSSESSSNSESQANQQKYRIKFGRKSMLYKTKKKREEATEKVRQSLGDALFEKIKKDCKTVRERRPILALLALTHNRKDVNNALGIYTNKFEWRKCRIHAHHPGPLKSVRKPLIQRLRIPKKLLHNLLNFLNDPGNLQRSAFGTQLRVLLDGRETCELDNVSRLKKLDKLLCDFITYILSEIEVLTSKDGKEIPEDNHRCNKLDQKAKFLRCMKGRKHEGACEFTATASISPSTVRTLVDSLTAGDIKSLSGLDDVKVLKGRDNFIRLRNFAKQVCEHGEETKRIIERIDDCELFHQTDFVPHLQRVGTHKCNCLTCGFNDKGEL
jgi:hypothetical protein